MSGMHKDLVSRLISASIKGSTHRLSKKDRCMVYHYILDKNKSRKMVDLVQLSDKDLFEVFHIEQKEDYYASILDWAETGQI